MGERVVIVQLKKQYARLLGEYKFAEREAEGVSGIHEMDEAYFRIGKRQENLKKRMGQIAGSLRQFDAELEIGRIKPRYPRKPRARTGTYSRPVYAALRKATEPMTTRELAKVVAAAIGKCGEAELSNIGTAIYNTLSPRVGRTVKVEGCPMRWSLVARLEVLKFSRAA